MVEEELRRRNYAVLSTASQDGKPHSAGVSYGVSALHRAFALYIVTDRRSRKARNIAANPHVSLTIPLPRRLLSFLPPNSIQFQGAAEILALDDEAAREAFQGSLVLRRILRLQLEQKAEHSVFLCVRPGRVIFTYGVGLSLLALMRNIEAAASRVEVPQARLQPVPPVHQASGTWDLSEALTRLDLVTSDSISFSHCRTLLPGLGIAVNLVSVVYLVRVVERVS